MVSPGCDDADLENQLSGIGPDSPAPKGRKKKRPTEDELFMSNIKKKAHGKGLFGHLKSFAIWTLTLFGIPKLLYRALKFTTICTGQALWAMYAYTVWECCGWPVSKMNQSEVRLRAKRDSAGGLLH